MTATTQMRCDGACTPLRLDGRSRDARQRHRSWAAIPAAVLAIAAALNPPAAMAAACEPASPGGPLFITETCEDPVLNQPYVDVDQPGSVTDPDTGVTVNYRYVHGGFTGTNALFAFYFPAADQYKGRFFESTYPTVTREGASAGTIAFAISNGAYVVSTNNAGGVPAGGALAPFRANAAAAKYSRVLAAQIYGDGVRPRGYLYGASGGAYQTLGSAENTSGVWDGTVPMVPGVPNAIPSFQASQLLALRVLHSVLPQIADAMAPGGSGDPFAGLSAEQKAVLTEVTKLGFPLRGWWQHASLTGGAYGAVAGAVKGVDPGYVQDFWNTTGYEGTDPAVSALRLQHETNVVSLDGARGLVLANVPTGHVTNADLVVTSGPAAGQTALITGVSGNTVQLAANPGITAGSTVRIDNSWLLALQYFARHQVPSSDQYGWKQYLDAGGAPVHAQRPYLVGPILARSTSGAVATGRFNGKMIMLAATMDVQAYPWSADWYAKQAKAAMGESFEGGYRLWFMDNADHDSTRSPLATNHIVGYGSALQQALLYLDAWVSAGTPPPASSAYAIDDYNAIQLPGTAVARLGIQPVATLAGPDGKDGETINITVDEPLTMSLKAAVPPGSGKIVKVEWDFKGDTGSFPVSIKLLDEAAPAVSFKQVMSFAKAGTYFPVARVTSQRGEDGNSPYAQVENLASIRVVVKDAKPSSDGGGAWSPAALLLLAGLAGWRRLCRRVRSQRP